MQTTTVETAEQLGLTADEFERIKTTLGRTPNFTELSMYSVMWSEHCSYKNSIVWLKSLPREGGRLLVKAGEENAGLVDIGDGWACVFKIESHNHPSALEPFQGAATGVGGIHRDIFTMGARPIAALNSLRFGNINDKRTNTSLKVWYTASATMATALAYLPWAVKYILKTATAPTPRERHERGRAESRYHGIRYLLRPGQPRVHRRVRYR